MENRGIIHTLPKNVQQFIEDHPNTPIAVIVGDCAYHGNGPEFCTIVDCKISLILDCYVPFSDAVFTDKSTFADKLAGYLSTTNEAKGLTSKEFDRYVQNELIKYEPYWKEAIAVYADN